MQKHDPGVRIQLTPMGDADKLGDKIAVPDQLADDRLKLQVMETLRRRLKEDRGPAAILSDEGLIERRHLSQHTKAVSAGSLRELNVIERQTIENALRQTDWNKSKTARRLGLTRTQLYVRLRRYGLETSAAG